MMENNEIKDMKRTLKREMMDELLEHVTHYRADIVYDFETVDDEIDLDSKYIWLLRETGTDIGRYSELYNPESWTALTVPRSSWAYIIENLELKQVPIEDIQAVVNK